MYENIKTIYFDYDGTIHNSIKVYAPAFRKAYKFLMNKGAAPVRKWEDEEISYWLGFSSQAMWEAFMPNLDIKLRQIASSIIGKEMGALIKDGKSILYEGAIETLTYLKAKGYRLVFISNCSIAYRDAARDTYKLMDFFDEMICSEEYDYQPKHEILRLIKESYPVDGLMIGDRMQDIEAGIMNNMLTIGCLYGFPCEGELDMADRVIDDVTELRELL
jgi:phosphoglycolate phosphatase